MTGPRRFTAPAPPEGEAPNLIEDDQGNLVYWSEYDALAEAFTLYMEAGMDEPEDVRKALAPMLGDEEIDFIVQQLEARKETAPPPKRRKRK